MRILSPKDADAPLPCADIDSPFVYEEERHDEASCDGRRGVHRLGRGASRAIARGHHGGQCRCADLCRLPRQRGERRGQPATMPSKKADIRDRAAMDRAPGRSTGPMRSCTSPPKAMWTGPSTGRGPSSTPTSPAPTRCWRPRAPTGRARQASREGVPVSPYLHRRGLWDAGRDGAFHRRHALCPQHRPIRRPRPPRITSCAPGTRPTACRWS
jgi:hypothetical protein